MPTISRVDFFPIPTQDVERSRAFYRDVLGLEQAQRTVGSPHAEFDLAGTTLSVWDPSSAGREFQANNNAVALHTDDVAGMRQQLEAAGVTFFAPTIDTGVCHMAFFADPDGNALMLHGRHAPHPE